MEGKQICLLQILKSSLYDITWSQYAVTFSHYIIRPANLYKLCSNYAIEPWSTLVNVNTQKYPPQHFTVNVIDNFLLINKAYVQITLKLSLL